VLSVGVAIVALGLHENPAIALVVGAASGIGAPVVLADYVRHRGQALQERLYATWGGSPTTLRLRHAGDPAQVEVRDRLRACVSEVTGVPLPKEAQGRLTPARADAAYAEAVAQLVRLTRDKQDFPLVFEENKNYGYARNLLAMRPLGISLGIASCATLTTACALSLSRLIPLPLINVSAGAVVDALILGAWLIVPSAAHVRRAGEAFADRLFEASWTLLKARSGSV
jgi:hypothetical protein